MTIKYYNILDVCQISLKSIRQRPTDGLLGMIINLTFLCITATSILLILILFFEINGDIDKLAKAAESLSTYSQVSHIS